MADPTLDDGTKYLIRRFMEKWLSVFGVASMGILGIFGVTTHNAAEKTVEVALGDLPARLIEARAGADTLEAIQRRYEAYVSATRDSVARWEADLRRRLGGDQEIRILLEAQILRDPAFISRLVERVATNYALPKGIILPWSAPAKVPIPNGWYVCNGQNGTPNLVGRFLRGTDEWGAIGRVGGEETHVHTFSGVTDEPAGYYVSGSTSGKEVAERHNLGFRGRTDPVAHLPPYVDVIYIMKVE